MNNVKAMAIKGISTLVLLYLILGAIYGMTFGNVLLVTIMLGIVGYIGDVTILPRSNNFISTVGDFILAFAVVWIMTAILTTGGNLFTISFFSALAVAAFEYFFHKYMANHVLGENQHNQQQKNLQYQTEAAEEFPPRLKNPMHDDE